MTKNLKVLGSVSCKKCTMLKNNIEKIIKENNFDINIEKIDDIDVIISYDVMSLPAIVIDENVVVSGRVPAEKEIIELLNK